MNGFFVSITNNLLDDKHYERMGNAVWLYMWLIDKMTEISEGQGIVNNGHPINYAMVTENFGTMSERTYNRMIAELREAGYINTVRAKYGLYITINKAKKQFGKAVSRTAKNGGSKPKQASKIRQKVYQDPPKMAGSSAKNGGSLYIDNKYNNNTITSNTNVLAEPATPARYGKPEINEMFDFWAQEVQYDIESRRQANRNACSNLIKKYGTDKLQQLIKGVAMAHSDPYAPRIADFVDLQSKTSQLVAWGKTKMHADLTAQPKVWRAKK